VFEKCRAQRENLMACALIYSFLWIGVGYCISRFEFCITRQCFGDSRNCNSLQSKLIGSDLCLLPTFDMRDLPNVLTEVY